MSPEMQKAMAACQSLRPNGGGLGQNNSAFQAYQACLKTHGVTLPARPQRPTGTPASGGQRPGGGGNVLGGLKTSDPKVAAAVKTCKPLLPTGAPNPAPS
jgi:hypothetical protein